MPHRGATPVERATVAAGTMSAASDASKIALRSRERVLHGPAALYDEPDALASPEHGDVLQGVALDDEQVRELALPTVPISFSIPKS